MEEVIIKRKRPVYTASEHEGSKVDVSEIDDLSILSDIAKTEGTGDKKLIPFASERIKALELHNKLDIQRQVKQKLSENFGIEIN